jgi:uncharacterized protein (DUF934 family)
MSVMKFIDPAHDGWQAATDGDVRPAPQRLLTLAQWQEHRAAWPAALPAGVVVPNDADIETLAADLPRFALIALHFPKWTDGRAYSQARLLRTRLRFRGELRATGEVLVDMLPLLARTGFDTTQLRADQNPAHARRALDFFAGHYQGDAAQPLPLFARHARDATATGAPRAERRAAPSRPAIPSGDRPTYPADEGLS